MNNSTEEPVVALVVAAGSGSRLGASVPKALVELGGMSLVRRSILAMRAGGVGHVVITTPEGCLPTFETALAGLDDVVCAVGGAKRQDSVRLGLDVLSERFGPETIVLIHDAARPLVPPQVVTAVACAVADGAEAAIPVIPVHDSIRQVGDDGSQVVDRDALRAVQTPQGARLGLLRDAHDHVVRNGLAITDDASAIETLGRQVVLVPGHHDALKITEQLDLTLAQVILDGRSRA